MTYQEMIANADANREALDKALAGGCWTDRFYATLCGALLNYVAPADFKNALETALKGNETCKHGKRWADCEPCRGWTERARLIHVYGPENI